MHADIGARHDHYLNVKSAGRGNQDNGIMDYVFDNNVVIFFLFLGLACTSLRLPRFFDDAGSHENAEDYLPFNDWFQTNNVTAVVGPYV